MASVFPDRQRRRVLAGLCVLSVVLAGCTGGGGGGGGGGGLKAVDSRLSVFGLRGAKPADVNDRSNDKIDLAGVAARADQDAQGAAVDTGLASMTIYYGGVGFKALDLKVNKETLDVLDLDAFGTIGTAWAGSLDSKGGAEDTFIADVETSRNSTVYETEDGRLTLRNMDGSGGTGLDYSTYGYWAAEFADFDRLVAFTIADPAAGTTVPDMGTAVYQGDMTGLYSTGLGAGSQAARGQATLTVDFAGQTVQGEVTAITAGAQTLRDVSLQQTALTGSTFTGAAATLPAGPGQTGPEMAGDYAGGLYGPSAPEAVGAFALTGAGGEALVGGFAAQQ
jgi:hypothetical protein